MHPSTGKMKAMLRNVHRFWRFAKTTYGFNQPDPAEETSHA
jgi:hypothetical protein